MQVISYTHSGHAPSQVYGFFCLFLIGFLWGGMGRRGNGFSGGGGPCAADALLPAAVLGLCRVARARAGAACARGLVRKERRLYDAPAEPALLVRCRLVPRDERAAGDVPLRALDRSRAAQLSCVPHRVCLHKPARRRRIDDCRFAACRWPRPLPAGNNGPFGIGCADRRVRADHAGQKTPSGRARCFSA